MTVRDQKGQFMGNPFKRDEKGQIGSLSEISRVTLENPTLAKQLCREAGEEVRRWFPENPK